MTLTVEPPPSPASRSALQLIRHIAPVRVLHVVPSLHGGGMERALARLLAGFADRMSEPRAEARGQVAKRPHQNRERQPVGLPDDQSQPHVAHGVCVLQGGDPDLIDCCRLTSPTWVLGDEALRPARRHIWRRLREIIAEFDPDVVHARATAAWFDTTFALRHHPRVHLLLSFHGRTSLDPHGWLRRRINRWTCHRADAVLAVSCEAARMLETEWDVPAHKIRVIANGVDTDRFHPLVRPRTLAPGEYTGGRRCGEPSDLPVRNPADHVVVCVANLFPIKGIDTLLQSWRRVVMADPQAKLWIVGEGPMREPLTRLSEELRVIDKVEFLGRRDDVPDLLRAADLFVLPSRYEASSNATLEAMATGLPVIAFDVGGMSELVRPNHTGWLVDAGKPDRFADTILAVLIDRSARQRVGQAARRAVLAEHGLPEWVDRYADLYRLLSEGGAPACAE